MVVRGLPLLIGAVGLLLLGGGWWYTRRETARLRKLLEAATSRLQLLQASFDSFAPAAVVEQIIDSGIPTTGERKTVTVLFADLVGFTPLSESVDPRTLVEILNGYFECMSRAIADHRGHVSTFLGDGILALFGALEPNPWQANDGLHAALAMREALATYNGELEAKGLPRLRIGVGLHRGAGIAGLVGSFQKKEFTIVGRTINVAARVQGLTRTYDGDILITEDLHKEIDPRFMVHPVGPVELRGVAHPVCIYAVDGFNSAGVRPNP